ncbi:hypothetical protein TNCV_979801 [Trichonephila clavipes]|uniref:Uncharacterized protein n=1 Tax=Trichonephila clavipes TaxID=2585209 RepID=A0A8X6VEB0_TRICX|nr:hypothetical protein TNCV_979801 [Trichonephila clavipes]
MAEGLESQVRSRGWSMPYSTNQVQEHSVDVTERTGAPSCTVIHLSSFTVFASTKAVKHLKEKKCSFDLRTEKWNNASKSQQAP